MFFFHFGLKTILPLTDGINPDCKAFDIPSVLTALLSQSHQLQSCGVTNMAAATLFKHTDCS